MKKVLALVLAFVCVLSLAACGDSVPEGSYKVIESFGDMKKYFQDVATLEVKADGSANLFLDLGEYSDNSDVVFDKGKGIVTFDDTEAKYSVSGDKITFTFSDGNTWVFEKK